MEIDLFLRIIDLFLMILAIGLIVNIFATLMLMFKLDDTKDILLDFIDNTERVRNTVVIPTIPNEGNE
jgi:hypothetical protein